MTSRVDPRFLVVGHLNKAHGIQGDVFVWTLTDHPESVFAPGVVLYLGDDRGRVPDDEPKLEVASVRPHKKGYLLRFVGHPTRNDAEALLGGYLLLPTEDLAGRDEDELFYHELLGLEVVTVDGTGVGRVREVYELEPSDLLEVRGDRTRMIPFRREIVKDIDLEARRMVIDPPEGLLDI